MNIVGRFNLDVPTLIEIFSDTVQKNGDRTAFIFEERNITYKQFWYMANQFAASLKYAGVQHGDRVAIMLPNIPEFIIAYYGILMNGCIAVPINILLKDHEIEYILDDAECKLIIVWESLINELNKSINNDEIPLKIIVLGDTAFPDLDTWDQFLQTSFKNFQFNKPGLSETAVILYTSGTTGHPRGVLLSYLNLSTNCLACVHVGAVTPRDICLGVLPFYHSFGQTAVMNTCIAAGAANVMLTRFEPEFVIKLIQKQNVTMFATVPTMYKLLVDFVDQPMKLPSVHTCLSGGSKLSMEIYHDFLTKFGLPIYEGYGLTEAAPVVSFNPMDYRHKVGSVGVPISGVDIKIVDESDREVGFDEVGEIVIRGPNVMKGYLNRPETTKEVLKVDWLYTGDLGKMDDSGFLYVLARKNDLIIKGGFNIYPKEVEQVLSYHPKVYEAAVIGIPDPVQGEEVKAYVSIKPGKRAGKRELIEYCKEHLALYKCPKYITFLRSLPKSSSGKILKRKLFIKKPKP